MSLNSAFRAQHGVIAREQAKALLSRHQIDHKLRSGQWQAVHRGVYRHRAVQMTWLTRLSAACLATGGIASHRCAAALLGLDMFTEPRIEVTVDECARGRAARGVLVHRSTQWSARQEHKARGIPCTGPERTIMDCGAVMSATALELLAEDAVRRHLTTWPRLERYLMRHARSGRNGCGTLRALFEARSPADALPLSEFSRLVVNLLVANGLPEPVLEHRILDQHGTLLLQADLAWPQLRKAWELDGLKWHGDRLATERDRRKRNAARAEGWQIQEILWSMYAKERNDLVAMARRFLTTTNPAQVA